MTDLDRFKLEDEGYDFPFYNKNPHIPKWGWIVLFIAVIIGTLLSMSESLHMTILCCIVFIVPVLYFLKWDYKAIFRMPSRRDILLAVALFIGYMIYSIAMSAVLEQFGIVSSGTVDPGSVTVMTLVTSIFSLMGEEFLKFIYDKCNRTLLGFIDNCLEKRLKSLCRADKRKSQHSDNLILQSAAKVFL